MLRTHSQSLATALFTVLLGLPSSAQDVAATEPAPDSPAEPRLVECSELAGAAILAPDGTRLGIATDLVVRTREGSAAWLIVSLDSETGNRRALPLTAVNWDRETLGLRLASEVELPELLPLVEPGAEPDESAWVAAVEENFGKRLGPIPAWVGPDPFEELFESTSPLELSGTVVAVMRGSMKGVARQAVVATLRDEENGERRVLLGPAWYLARSVGTPTVGTDLSVEGVAVHDASGPLLVASSVRVGEAGMRLRYGTGTPLWKDDEIPALLYWSQLRERSVRAKDGKLGRIGAILCDARTGDFEFVLSPSDEVGKSLALPWPALDLGLDGDLHIAIDREGLENAPLVTGGRDQLENDSVLRASVRTYFSVRPRTQERESRP